MKREVKDHRFFLYRIMQIIAAINRINHGTKNAELSLSGI